VRIDEKERRQVDRKYAVRGQTTGKSKTSFTCHAPSTLDSYRACFDK